MPDRETMIYPGGWTPDLWELCCGPNNPFRQKSPRHDTRSILLSIKPVYWTRILSGEKTFEYRRRLANWSLRNILFYVTAPVGKVMGYADCCGVMSADPVHLWCWSHKHAGISKEDFFSYFDGCDPKKCGAYMLRNVVAFDPPKELGDFGLRRAPQSFAYIDEVF